MNNPNQTDYVFFAEGKKIINKLPPMTTTEYRIFVSKNPQLRLPPYPESYYSSKHYKTRVLKAKEELAMICFEEIGIYYDVFERLKKAETKEDLIPFFHLQRYHNKKALFFKNYGLEDLRNYKVQELKDIIYNTFLDDRLLELMIQEVILNYKDISHEGSYYYKVINCDAYFLYGF